MQHLPPSLTHWAPLTWKSLGSRSARPRKLNPDSVRVFHIDLGSLRVLRRDCGLGATLDKLFERLLDILDNECEVVELIARRIFGVELAAFGIPVKLEHLPRALSPQVDILSAVRHRPFSDDLQPDNPGIEIKRLLQVPHPDSGIVEPKYHGIYVLRVSDYKSYDDFDGCANWSTNCFRTKDRCYRNLIIMPPGREVLFKVSRPGARNGYSIGEK